jgi:histidine triad (HIT) family protein
VKPAPAGRGLSDLEGRPCVFCDVLKGSAEAAFVYTKGEVVAIMDRYPINLGHVLVMPRHHFQNLLEVPEDIVAILFQTVQRVAGAVHRAMKADGLSIAQNNGTAAAQIVPHVHVHIVPRFYGDSSDGRWPVRKRVTMEELEATARTIGGAIAPVKPSTP